VRSLPCTPNLQAVHPERSNTGGSTKALTHPGPVSLSLPCIPDWRLEESTVLAQSVRNEEGRKGVRDSKIVFTAQDLH
jgi:hypothetical protein